MAQKTSSPDPQADKKSGGRRTWRVGTLVYTSGGIGLLFFWLLLGDFSWQLRERSVGPTTQWYLKHLEVSNLTFGLILTSFPAALSLLLGPVISVRSDRHRSRWGRRLPYLIFTTPLAAAGMIGIGLTPILAKWMHHHFPQAEAATVALVCFCVFWTIFEFSAIISQTVFGALINDVVPAELLGRFYGLFRAISLFDGIVFNFWIVGLIPTHFTIILVSIGLFYGISFMGVCFKVKEGEYPPVENPSKKTGSLFQNAGSEIVTYMRECFGRFYYVAIYGFTMLTQMAFAPINIFAWPYANHLGISIDTYGKFLALTYLISLVFSYPLGWLADRFHPLRVGIVAMVGYALLGVFGFLFANSSSSFLTAWVMHGVLAGTFGTATASLLLRLLPHEKFAQYASASGIILSFAWIGIAPLTGWIIDVSGDVYRYAFGVSFVLAGLSLLVSIYVYSRFMSFGGPKGYHAPE